MNNCLVQIIVFSTQRCIIQETTAYYKEEQREEKIKR